MRLLAASAIALLIGAAPAAAELVVIEYQGLVESVQPVFASIATPGDPATGCIVYDTATADTDPDPSSGIYPNVTFEFSFGAFSGTSTGGFVRIFDDASLPAFDAFQVVDFDPAEELGTIDGLPVTSILLALNGSVALYASDALPSAPPALTDPALEDAYASITVVPPGTGSTPLRAEISSITVPEPAGSAGLASLLVMAARAAFGRRLRRY